MKYYDKQKLFETFLNEWGEKFNKVHFILNYISAYPELISKIKDFNPIEASELNKSQFEWISLISQLDKTIDSNFFKTYWVPIQNNSYDYFIDLSSDTFTLFETSYFFIEPYNWYKKYLFEDITIFLVSVDYPSISIDEIIQNNEEKRLELLEEFFKERNKLGFLGKIDLKPINYKNLFFEKEESNYQFIEDILVLTGINSIAIGLIPIETEIILNHFVATFNKDEYIMTKIKNINALVFLIENVGFLSVHYYHLTFKSEPDSYLEFQNNKLSIKSTDKLLIEQLIENFEHIKNG